MRLPSIPPRLGTAKFYRTLVPDKQDFDRAYADRRGCTEYPRQSCVCESRPGLRVLHEFDPEADKKNFE